MMRTIGAVVFGYVVMAAAIFALFSLVYRVMGAERAYQPGSYEVSTLWLGVSIVVGFVAAVLGGRIAVKVGGTRAVRGLVGVVVLLGLLTAVYGMVGDKPDPGPRSGDVPIMDAMTKSQSPSWIEWANIAVGVAGTLVGGRGRAAATPA